MVWIIQPKHLIQLWAGLRIRTPIIFILFQAHITNPKIILHAQWSSCLFSIIYSCKVVPWKFWILQVYQVLILNSNCCQYCIVKISWIQRILNSKISQVRIMILAVISSNRFMELRGFCTSYCGIQSYNKHIVLYFNYNIKSNCYLS